MEATWQDKANLENKLVARVLRSVAACILDNYEPGYYGMGGPQDGEDEPPKFYARRAAQQLLEEAAELEAAAADA